MATRLGSRQILSSQGNARPVLIKMKSDEMRNRVFEFRAQLQDKGLSIAADLSFFQRQEKKKAFYYKDELSKFGNTCSVKYQGEKRSNSSSPSELLKEIRGMQPWKKVQRQTRRKSDNSNSNNSK